jgi:hypothetical protein
MEQKIEEVWEEEAEVRGLAALYLPIKPANLKQAFGDTPHRLRAWWGEWQQAGHQRLCQARRPIDARA